tara:strand:+ start:279 stop:2246 length:1968 start_codon:yes stop_codon:yes gene_type:complete
MAAKNGKNVRNPASPLFKRLTRLFSGPIVNYRAQNVNQNRRRDTEKYANQFQSASGKQFKRMGYDPFSDLTANIYQNQSRLQRYIDFDQMEYEPIIASALDIYADEMTTSSQMQPLLNIHCQNEEIKIILNSLFHNVLNIEHNIFNWCRTLCKYGDYIVYLDIDEKHGIENIISLPLREVERLEGEDKTNPNYVQYQWNSAGMTFENWQIAHFRILGNDKHAPYGTSVLDPSRRIFRQLTLLEDAMMAYRIVRSPERRVFYVDVGNMAPNDVEQYMQKVMTSMKRNQVVDADTGRVDLRYNPMSVDEDYFIPTRGGQSTRVESLPGGTYTGDIDDVKYLKDKLFSALKIPQSYLFRGEGADEDKATLAQKDIRFARTIQRLQRVVITELEKIAIIHLFTLGYRENDLISFKLSMNNPSKIAELQDLEQWRTKFDVASAAAEGFFSKRWIAENLFSISEEEFLRNQREMFYDRMITAEMDQSAEATDTGLGGGGGGLLGGDEPAGELDTATGDDMPPPADDPAAEPAGETPAAEEPDTNLLAVPPANRDDKMEKKVKGKTFTTTPKSKGKFYEPRKDLSGKRAMQRQMSADAGSNLASSTSRNINKGYQDLSRLARGIKEEQDSNYKKEEEKIFEINNEVKRLINELETKQNVNEN